MAEHVPNHRLYSAGEILADALLHGAALFIALWKTGVMFGTLVFDTGFEASLLVVQAIAVCVMLVVSGLYNAWPISPFKWTLRRVDHAFIFILIAATYLVPLAQLALPKVALGLGSAIWLGAIAGAALKLFWPGRHEKLAIAAYLVLGWAGIVAFPAFASALSANALWAYVLGGVTYTLGVPFYLWNRLPYNIVIWHGFVGVAALIHLHAAGLALAG